MIPGTFHCLEHLLHSKSQRYPERASFGRKVGLYGGVSNAATGPTYTTYWISLPTERLDECLPGLFSSVFEPCFTDADLSLERETIATERRRKERWDPGKNEIGHFMGTQWVTASEIGVRTRLGTDDDLAAMSVDSLLQAHRYYFHRDVCVFTIGSGYVDSFLRDLEKVETHGKTLERLTVSPRWMVAGYHEQAFTDACNYELCWAGFMDTLPPILTRCMIDIAMSYLTNDVHGPLHEWLRTDRGIVYALNAGFNCNDHMAGWFCNFPVGRKEYVQELRAELPNRIERAFEDGERIKREIARILYEKVFSYQRARDIIDAAMRCYEMNGRIETLAEMTERIASTRPDQLAELYNNSMRPSLDRMLCVMPKS